MATNKKSGKRAAPAAPVKRNKQRLTLLAGHERATSLLDTQLEPVKVDEERLRRVLVSSATIDVAAVAAAIRDDAPFWKWRARIATLRLEPRERISQAMETIAVMDQFMTRMEHMNSELRHELRAALDMEDPSDIYVDLLPGFLRIHSGLRKAVKLIDGNSTAGRKPGPSPRTAAKRNLKFILRARSTPKLSDSEALGLADAVLEQVLDWPSRK